MIVKKEIVDFFFTNKPRIVQALPYAYASLVSKKTGIGLRTVIRFVREDKNIRQTNEAINAVMEIVVFYDKDKALIEEYKQISAA